MASAPAPGYTCAMPSTPLARRLRPLLIAAVFIPVFHAFIRQTIIGRDAFILYAPAKFVMAEGLRHGRLWGWDGSELAGLPLIADILASMYYPLNLIFLALPFAAAYRLFILIHYPIAALSMDLFLRGRGIGRPAALVGAMAFALGGYMICQHNNPPFLIGPAWAPLALYFFGRALEDRLDYAAAAGAVLALQIFGGEPQSAAITAAVIAVWGARRAAAARPRLRPLLAVAVAGGASLALAAAQLLPTYELLRLSARRGGMTLADTSVFSFHPGRLIELIWPNVFGALWPKMGYYGDFALDRSWSNTPWTETVYLGLPVIALAVLGMVKGRNRGWLIAGAGAFFLLGLGRFTPVYGAAQALIPPMAWFRYPEKYLVWTFGILAVAAAGGFEVLLAAIEARPRRVVRAALIYAGAVAAALAVSMLVWPAALDLVFAPDKSPVWRSYAIHNLWRGGTQVLIVSAVAAGLAILAASKIVPRRALGLAAAALVIVDLGVANVSTMPRGPADLYDARSAAVKLISPDGPPAPGSFRMFRDPLEFFDRNRRRASPAFVRYRLWSRDVMMGNLGALEGIEQISGYSDAVPEEGRHLLDEGLNREVLELYNVKYVISAYRPDPPAAPDIETVLNDPDLDLRLIRLKNVRPRAFWVPAAVAAPDGGVAEQLVKTVDRDKFVVVTTRDPVGPADPGEQTMKPARITRYEPERVELTVDAPAAGWLVLMDRHYPGWRAEVDGRPAPIALADGVGRGVRVQAGRHEVVFRFASSTVRVGAAISGVAWLALFVGIAVRRRASGLTVASRLVE
jgi:hypothetical protein